MIEELGPLARVGQAISTHVYKTGHFGWDSWDSASDQTAGWRCRACALVITAPLEEILVNPLSAHGLAIRDTLLNSWVQAGFADRKKTLWQRILDED